MALLRYTLLRLALLGVVAGVLYLLSLRGFLLLLVAFLVSGIISIFVLNRARDDVSRQLSGRVGRINERLAEPPSPEDEPDREP